jgi:hypothetical protein
MRPREDGIHEDRFWTGCRRFTAAVWLGATTYASLRPIAKHFERLMQYHVTSGAIAAMGLGSGPCKAPMTSSSMMQTPYLRAMFAIAVRRVSGITAVVGL